MIWKLKQQETLIIRKGNNMTMEGFVSKAINTKPAQEEHSFWSLETKFGNQKMRISFNIFARENKKQIWVNLLRVRRNNCLIKKKWVELNIFFASSLEGDRKWIDFTTSSPCRSSLNVFFSFHSFKSNTWEKRVHLHYFHLNTSINPNSLSSFLRGKDRYKIEI